jgi:hypothetical protein
MVGQRRPLGCAWSVWELRLVDLHRALFEPARPSFCGSGRSSLWESARSVSIAGVVREGLRGMSDRAVPAGRAPPNHSSVRRFRQNGIVWVVAHSHSHPSHSNGFIREGCWVAPEWNCGGSNVANLGWRPQPASEHLLPQDHAPHATGSREKRVISRMCLNLARKVASHNIHSHH